MKAEKTIATYARLRTQPLWRLLASVHGYITVALLESHLYGEERSLPASIFYERIERDLEELRARGQDLPCTAQVYVADWLREGHLERRFPPGASEEEYELSTSTVEAVRFVSGLSQPHSAATESRLVLVIEALVRLAEETDADVDRRADSLIAERQRIDQQIEALYRGELHVIPDHTALERVREIISLASDLAGDFRRVRDQFEQLNRELREQLLDNDGRRGDVLNSLFAGIDLITNSEAGRTFSAFWRLLTDPEQAAMLEVALEGIFSRQFVGELPPQSRRFLRGMTGHLLEQGGLVHEVLQNFARSLKTFVQSREYLEQRHLHQLLKDAQRAALKLKDEVKATEALQYVLDLTSSRLQSYSQLELHDPSLQAVAGSMTEGSAPYIGLDSIVDLVAQSEIDFRALKANVLSVLDKYSAASIAMVLEECPAMQGLGSVVGLLALGSRHGFRTANSEIVSWCGLDEQRRNARIPTIYFLKERAGELV